MKNRHFWFSFFLALVLATLVVAGIYIREERQYQMDAELTADPFYRTKDELDADGVRIITLDNTGKGVIREAVLSYFSNEYKERFRAETEMLAAEARDEKTRDFYERDLAYLDDSIVAGLTISKPRMYERVDEIVGVFASAGFRHERGVFGTDTLLFFFHKVGDSYVFVRALPVGEYRADYERAPLMKFMNTEKAL